MRDPAIARPLSAMLAEGGEFEAVYVRLALHWQGRPTGLAQPAEIRRTERITAEKSRACSSQPQSRDQYGS
jgi:hypothetical protein